MVEGVSRGLVRRCPACGRGHAFQSYLKLVDRCAECDAPLGRIRADDMPPYVTMFIVGHVVVGLGLLGVQYLHLPQWFEMTFWPIVAVALTLGLLPYVKGGCVGAMWALRLTGEERQGTG
jgi:uncharacterized protein (DUF983 family)